MKTITYQEAMTLLVAGKFLRCASWASTSYIWMLPAAVIPLAAISDPHLKRLAASRGGSIEMLPVIRMVNNGAVSTGWAPSIAEICDWWEEVFP
jgi:hypothetical protein